MLVAGKRNYNHKILREKWQAHKDLEKGMSNRDVAAKHLLNLGQEQRKTFRFTRKSKLH